MWESLRQRDHINDQGQSSCRYARDIAVSHLVCTVMEEKSLEPEDPSPSGCAAYATANQRPEPIGQRIYDSSECRVFWEVLGRHRFRQNHHGHVEHPCPTDTLKCA